MRSKLCCSQIRPLLTNPSIIAIVILVWLYPGAASASMPSLQSATCAHKLVDAQGVGVTRKLRILEKPEAIRTKKARTNRTEGVVVLSVVLNASKKVTDIGVLQRLPDGLTESAIKVAERIRFEPALKDGCPVSVKLRIEYNFTSSN